MSHEDFEKYQKLVLEDLSLQERLKTFVERTDFISEVVVSGAERGFDISREDVENELRLSRRNWHKRWI
ncbi:MAG: Aspartyl/asparaginyl beta-hydroxylase [Acidobacteria bacterium]|jgi:hypothetical protein|nr:Aspartyl/asparaginyl beta-hydroxylase [Acidobacteriota bacterium]